MDIKSILFEALLPTIIWLIGGLLVVIFLIYITGKRIKKQR